MSKQFLQMKYHPAKKEVEFHRFQSGTEIPIRKDSKLKKYENKRGNFVLQDHGNTFLSDIVETFDGERTVDIKVITTKNDYEDFLQMLDYFNDNSQTKINATLIAELPDMGTTYSAVKKHGESAISILKKHRAKFFDIDMKNPEVQKVVESFSADVQAEVDSITEKIDSMSDNNVNLCFTGVYSAGKSALINSILGCAILPENINSETARMFCIQSPKRSEKIRIVFTIRDNFTELIWDENKKVFEFATGPVESASRKAIQDIINENKGELQHKQIYEILKTLNTDKDVSSGIRVYFPVPLDNDKVQFTIYDTPGTDSNYGEHQTVLQDALSEQTHSILIFVAAPNKTEGQGNNALLKYLREAEKKDSKTSIDLGRSLFVINWADSIGPEERIDLQSAEIKDKDDPTFSIKLYDKKLFFTSAKVAYAAKAKQNGIAGKSEEFTIKKNRDTISDPDYGRYYKQNRCATSESQTKRMLECSEAALAKAESNGDTLEVLHICSGLYALENEIVMYGEKYAAAVRAFAIIDSVDKALSKMKTNAQALEKQNQENLDAVDAQIAELRCTVSKGIKDAYDEIKISQGKGLPDNILKELHLNDEYITKSFIAEPKSFFEKLLKGRFFGLGGVKFSEKHKAKIEQEIRSILDDFTRNFCDNRNQVLKRQRDSFISAVKKVIKENGELSEEAKRFMLNIRTPEIPAQSFDQEFGKIYESSKQVRKVLWFDREDLDKDKFIDEAISKLNSISSSMRQAFEEEYRNTLRKILSAVETEFNQNLEKYSVLLKAMLKDKKALEQLGLKINEAAQELLGCQDKLNDIIWSIKNDDK